MRNPPAAPRLIALVRDLLREGVKSGTVPGRYDILLAGAALDVALRELEDGARIDAEAAHILEELMTSRDPGAALAEIARAIRAGERDGDTVTHEALIALAETYLRESNPKALEPESL